MLKVVVHIETSMAKYSTGDGGDSGDSSSCELCGEESGSLTEARVAGALLMVCNSCKPHDDADRSKTTETEKTEKRKRRKEVTQKATGGDTSELWDSDTSHWEQEGTEYDADPLPYLESGYGDRVASARQDAGLKREELAEKLDVPENDLLAVEQGRATSANVGGSVIEALEAELDIDITE